MTENLVKISDFRIKKKKIKFHRSKKNDVNDVAIEMSRSMRKQGRKYKIVH